MPLGITHPTNPNLPSTLWRTVHNHRNKVFFFDSATSPNTFWVPLDELDFSKAVQVHVGSVKHTSIARRPNMANFVEKLGIGCRREA